MSVSHWYLTELSNSKCVHRFETILTRLGVLRDTKLKDVLCKIWSIIIVILYPDCMHKWYLW